MKIQFIEKKFNSDSLYIIKHANEIISQYVKKGFQLTLRQLYYQFVARGLIENNDKQYKRVGSIINNGRLAGVIDWNAIEDRTRLLYGITAWDSPQEIVQAAISNYHVDKWIFSKNMVEVWVEKDALSEVVGKAAKPYDVSYMACRGYPSQSSLYKAFQRYLFYKKNRGKEKFVILYLGDHDPSGIDIPRDIKNRFDIFCNDFDMNVELKIIAMNYEQVQKYKPPPNPAKLSDARAAEYCKKYGDQSWELDAIDPEVIIEIIKKHIEKYVEKEAFGKAKMLEDEGRQQIKDAVVWMNKRS